MVEQVLATEVSKLEDGSSSEQEQGRKASDQSTVDDEGASNNTLPDTRFKRSFDEAVNETTEDEHSVNTTEYSSSYQSEQDPKGRAFDAQTQALDESTTTDDASEIEYATRHHGQQQLLHVVRRSPQVTLEDSGSTWETVQATEEEFGGRAADVTTLEPLSERADDSTGTEELPSGRHESVSEPVAEVLKEDEIRSVNVTDDDHQNVTCRRSHGHPENSVTAEPSDPDNTTDDHVARFVVDITETVEVSARNAVTEEEVTDGHYLHLQAWNSSLEQESSDDN